MIGDRLEYLATIFSKVATEWPQSVVDLAVSGDDFPSMDDIWSNERKNAKRETL